MNRNENAKLQETARQLVDALAKEQDAAKRIAIAERLNQIIDFYHQEVEAHIPVALSEVGITYKDTGLQPYWVNRKDSAA